MDRIKSKNLTRSKVRKEEARRTRRVVRKQSLASRRHFHSLPVESQPTMMRLTDRTEQASRKTRQRRRKLTSTQNSHKLFRKSGKRLSLEVQLLTKKSQPSLTQRQLVTQKPENSWICEQKTTSGIIMPTRKRVWLGDQMMGLFAQKQLKSARMKRNFAYPRKSLFLNSSALLYPTGLLRSTTSRLWPWTSQEESWQRKQNSWIMLQLPSSMTKRDMQA